MSVRLSADFQIGFLVCEVKVTGLVDAERANAMWSISDSTKDSCACICAYHTAKKSAPANALHHRPLHPLATKAIDYFRLKHFNLGHSMAHHTYPRSRIGFQLANSESERGYLAEARIFQLLSAENAPFVRCFEASVCDGLIPLDKSILEGNSATKFLKAVANPTLECIAFDVKKIDPYTTIGLLIHTHPPAQRLIGAWKVNPDQEDSADFLLIHLMPSQSFALVPICYIWQFQSAGYTRRVLGSLELFSRGLRWTQAIPDFLAFIIRPEHLGEAFDRIRRCAADSSLQIENPTTKVKYSSWSINPKLADVATRTTAQLMRKSRDQLLGLVEAINGNSDSGLSIDFVPTAPLLADFCIHHKDRTFFCEAKRNYYVYQKKGETLSHGTGRFGTGIIPMRKPVDWHYLFTESEKHQEAFLVPKTELEDWPVPSVDLRVKFPASSWSQYRIDFTSPDWVDRFAQILEVTQHLFATEAPSLKYDDDIEALMSAQQEVLNDGDFDLGWGHASEDDLNTSLLVQLTQYCAHKYDTKSNHVWTSC